MLKCFLYWVLMVTKFIELFIRDETFFPATEYVWFRIKIYTFSSIMLHFHPLFVWCNKLWEFMFFNTTIVEWRILPVTQGWKGHLSYMWDLILVLHFHPWFPCTTNLIYNSSSYFFFFFFRIKIRIDDSICLVLNWLSLHFYDLQWIEKPEY